MISFSAQGLYVLDNYGQNEQALGW